MSARRNALLQAVVALLLSAQMVMGRCYVDNSSGIQLPRVFDANGNVVCPQGFLCPGFGSSDPSTFPVFCPPTPECQVHRLQGRLCTTSMGVYEPVLCPSGYYCPNATTKLKCPSGYYCPFGQRAPRKCVALSSCPEKSAGPTQLLSLVILVVLAAGAALAVQYYRRRIVPSSPASTTDKRRTLGESYRQSHGSQKPLTIQFCDLRVKLREKKDHTLVQAVSGCLRPGTVTAILGPSGSGKTVLLRALLGRFDANWEVGGSVTINNDGSIWQYRSMIGTVPQDDVLHTELTVYRNVLYAASLRLPSSWTEAERVHLVDTVLESLGLAHVADVTIGDSESRGVSGGQRKRTSVAVELVAAPRALFLDEPTKGLDSNTALELVNTLRAVAGETDLTVAMAINQPRSEIWNALDEILILAPGGRTVFQGSRRAIEEYMTTTFNLEFPRQANPADVILDAVSVRGNEMADVWVTRSVAASPTGSLSVVSFDAAVREEMTWNGASFLRQVALAHTRYIEKQMCLLSSLYIEVGVATVMGFILGFSISQNEPLGQFRDPFKLISPYPLTALPAQLHMYAFMSLGLATSTAGVNVFVNDKQTYARAAACGSSTLAHYLGTVTASWYRLFLVTLAFASPYHFLGKSATDFAPFYFVFFLFSWITYSVASIIALLSDPTSASLIAGVLSIVYGVFSGFIDFPLGMKRLSFCYWAAQSLQQWMFQDTETIFEDLLSEWGWQYDQIGVSFGVMIAMGLIYHGVACLLLVCSQPPK